MTTATLSRNALVHWKGADYRLVRYIDDRWQMERLDSGRIVETPLKQLHEGYVCGELKFHRLIDKSTGTAACRPRQGIVAYLTPGQLATARMRLAYVEASMKLQFTKGAKTDQAIAKVWEAIGQPAGHPPPFGTIARWRARWLASGRDAVSLAPQSGRPTREPAAIDPDVLAICRDVIDEVYLSLQRPTVRDTWNEIRARILIENRQRPERIHLRDPSEYCVRRLIKEIPAYDVCKARFGKATADNRFRSAMGGMVVKYPLERAEIDHTCLDLIVVDEKTGTPLGRPYITACIDCHTRCVLGMWVSFDPPSYESVAQCLRHAILPKTKLRETSPETTNEWIAHGVMRTLVVDNGLEFHSLALEKACLELQIELEYAARKSGWLKGSIERYLGALNRSMLHRIPGTTFSNVLHKGEYASVANAGVRYSTLKQLLVKWVVDIYHQSPHPKLGKPRDEVWREALNPLAIRYPADIDALDAAIGRTKTLRLTHKGIELFPELFYNSVQLADWRRRAGNALRLEVAYSTADLASIIVHGEDGSPIRVPSTNPEYATGLTLWQHEKCRELVLHRQQKANSENLLLAKHELREMIDLEFKKTGATRRTHKRLARFMEQHGSGQLDDAPIEPVVGPYTPAAASSAPAALAGAPPSELPAAVKNAAIPRFTPVVRKQEKP